METVNEQMLRELEQAETMYGKVNITHFRLKFHNQKHTDQFNTQPVRYYATTRNVIELEVQLEINNPFTYQKARFCTVTLTANASILKKSYHRFVDKEEVEAWGKYLSEYVNSLLYRFLLSNNSDVKDGDNLYLLQNLEHSVFSKRKERK